MLKMLSIFGYALMAGGAVGFVVTRTIVSPLPAVIAVQVAAFALMVWARVTFKGRSFHLSAEPTEGGLVTTGPYRFVRHPIYTAVCLFFWAAFFGTPSRITALLALLVTVGALVRIGCEERCLHREFPEYAAYARRTKRMVPFLF
jgi:protein-S-isoprenylcysteine O-methyltransferase Ste14